MVRNERVKLIATMLNTVAAHCFTLGVVAPMVGIVLGTGLPNTPVSNEALVAALIVFPLLGLVIHLLASFLLWEMRADDET